MSSSLLIIDDHIDFTQYLRKILNIKKIDVEVMNDPVAASTIFPTEKYFAVLLDVMMPNLDGMQLLDIIIKANPNLPVIMMSNYGTIDIAIDAVNKGAADFIEKPFDIEILYNKLLRYHPQHSNGTPQSNEIREILERNDIIAESPVMRQILDKIVKLAKTDVRVLIQGETGTGKEVVARLLHSESSRQNQPYLQINCAAIPADLLESELFGFKKGAFTGAHMDHEGKFVAADGGTLLLDEIGDMNMNLQAKILRVLEENEVEELGGTAPRKVDVRVIVATNKALKILAETGQFRKDLYHRLNVVSITVPPLRERKEDIVPLAQHFMQQYGMKYSKSVTSFSRNAELILTMQPWEGNVRELKNVVEHIAVFAESTVVSAVDVYYALDRIYSLYSKSNITSWEDKIIELKQAHQQFEKEYILKALVANDWNINQTSSELNIDRTNLFKKMKKHNITR